MISCWCGNSDLKPFSPDYLLCPACHSLVLRAKSKADLTDVTDADTDLYGKNYYQKHLSEKYGYPDFATRVRTDLPERCLYWLRTLLKYKIPPASVLELGSAHGGFVAMLHWAGFYSTGLELSPWLADFAHATFDVPMLTGPIEKQAVEPGSLDVVVLMDVLEHLCDPIGTIRHCLRLMKPDGILLIQTPSFPQNKSYEKMKEQKDSFLLQLKEAEHVYLFSKDSIGKFFGQLGVKYIEFETAIFSHYDMFLGVSREPFVHHSPEEIEIALSATPSGRLIQALIDIDEEKNVWIKKYQEAEADRAARLVVIEEQAKQFAERLADAETEKAAKLEIIENQAKQLAERLADAETEKAAKLEVIENQAKELEAFRGSLSWKLTAPGRWVLDRLGKLK